MVVDQQKKERFPSLAAALASLWSPSLDLARHRRIAVSLRDRDLSRESGRADSHTPSETFAPGRLRLHSARIDSCIAQDSSMR
jgi:hypothetical protein